MKTKTERHTIYFIVILAFLAVASLVYTTMADPNATNITGYPVFTGPPLSITNGQCVPLNSTVDISPLGWGVSELRYYGPYYDAYSPMNETPRRTLPIPNTFSALHNFYINPSIFGNATGYWYQGYSDGLLDKSGNLRMFYVNATCPTKTVLKVATIAYNYTNASEPEKLPSLPENYVASALVARGDTVSIPASHGSTWWLFGYGRDSGIYNQTLVNDTVVLSPENMKGLTTGDYHLIVVNTGANNILEAAYNKTTKTIESPFRNTKPVYVGDLSPNLVEGKLNALVGSSIDDSIATTNMVYQTPEIQFTRIDELYNPDHKSFYDIRGYTNEMAGTELTITIDAGKLNGRSVGQPPVKTNATGANIGSMRQFNALIPIDYDGIAPGTHNITITSPLGAKTSVEFYIRQESPNSYVPPQYTEYLGTSPYVTPKIETVTVIVTVPVINTVVVHDTPSQESVDAAQKKAEDAAWNYWITTGIEAMVVIVGGFVGIRFLYRSWKRKRWMQK